MNINQVCINLTYYIPKRMLKTEHEFKHYTNNIVKLNIVKMNLNIY